MDVNKGRGSGRTYLEIVLKSPPDGSRELLGLYLVTENAVEQIGTLRNYTRIKRDNGVVTFVFRDLTTEQETTKTLDAHSIYFNNGCAYEFADKTLAEGFQDGISYEGEDLLVGPEQRKRASIRRMASSAQILEH